MQCCWVSDEDTCGSDAELRGNLPLCEVHHSTQTHRRTKYVCDLVSNGINHNPLDSYPGLCYFALLPDGLVKIGYSNTEVLLNSRMQSLSRDYGAPVIKLAVIRGGFAAEAFMHERFKGTRVPGNGERFSYSPDMAEFLSTAEQAVIWS